VRATGNKRGGVLEQENMNATRSRRNGGENRFSFLTSIGEEKGKKKGVNYTGIKEAEVPKRLGGVLEKRRTKPRKMSVHSLDQRGESSLNSGIWGFGKRRRFRTEDRVPLHEKVIVHSLGGILDKEDATRKWREI